MNKNSNDHSSKNEFDLFYAIIKDWKIILLASIAFALLGFLYLMFSPKPYATTTGFSIALDESIPSAYGEYHLKTQNPSHYLSIFDSPNFKDSVLANVGISAVKNLDFKINKERIDLPPNREELIFPSKFELVVSAVEGQNLIEISEQAIALFLEMADNRIQEDMLLSLSSKLSRDIDNQTLDVRLKKDLVASLDESITNGEDLNPKSLKEKITNNNKLLSSKSEDSKLISSILISDYEGATNYLNAVLAVEQIELKKMENDLERKTILFDKLNENKTSLNAVFGQPFSDFYLELSSAEFKDDGGITKTLTQVIVFFLAGFFISTVVIGFKSYYHIIDERKRKF